ncbi:MAG: class I SAM-dependent methyltransferase [Burkholderiales bacterium]
MFNGNTDKEWEKFGKNDPYFGVLTHDKFRKINLTDENKEEFFRSGFNHIDNVLEKIRRHIDQTFTIKKALDFGCGVGRLVIPLANVALEVTGVDVSDSMLNEAKKNCEARSLKNVVLVKSDDNLSLSNDKYDFIHSFIVFQHIPVTRGERIFENLIAHLESDGICVVHFTYAKTSTIRKIIQFMKKYVPLSSEILNLIMGQRVFAPQMQMNAYDVNRLFLTMQKANVFGCYSEFTNHGGELGIVVYFKKPRMA